MTRAAIGTPPASLAETCYGSAGSSGGLAFVVEMQLPVEQFNALTDIPDCRHLFTRRVPGIDAAHDKTETLRRLEAAHFQIRRAFEIADWPLLTAEQTHGNKIVVVDRAVRSDIHFAGCDGLITNQRRAALGIHVADCCAVYIVDSKTPAIGLVHSGKKGTELGVVTTAIEQMRSRFGSEPSELIAQLSPCIRPPHYETDFAAEIIEQLRNERVGKIYDCETCTACHPDLYYSYRAEKGRSGRMLALLGLK